MVHHIYVERQGVLEEFLGRDDSLVKAGSFVLTSGTEQAVAKWSDGYWDVWARVPSDLSDPLGVAKLGKHLGKARTKHGFPNYWEAFPSADGGAGISTKPSPYGGGSLGGAVTELLRLA